MAGTEQGMLFGCNRKGKCAMEKIQLRVSLLCENEKNSH